MLHLPSRLGVIAALLFAMAVSVTASAQERLMPGDAFRDCAACPEIVDIPAGMSKTEVRAMLAKMFALWEIERKRVQKIETALREAELEAKRIERKRVTALREAERKRNPRPKLRVPPKLPSPGAARPAVGTARSQYPPTYSEPNGRTWTCYAPHARTGQTVPVKGQTVPVKGTNEPARRFLGFATHNRRGWPVIIFDVSLLSQLPLIVVRFTYYHECAHLAVPTRNEIRANCVGLQKMRRNGDIFPRQEETLRRVHYSATRLEAQYGGNGKAFWDATMRCAGPPN